VSRRRDEAGHVRPMTVVQIRTHKDRNYVDVVFLESARFYKLMKTNPNFGSILEQLEGAQESGAARNIVLASVDSDVIEDVAP
jgi:hypothetical protein